MYVSPAKQIFKCFACGAGGSAFNFLMRRENMTFPEVVRLLADRGGIKLPERRRNVQDAADVHDLEEVNRWAAKFFRRMFEEPDEGSRAREYVVGRGISEDTSRRFGLGWACDSWDRLKAAAEADGIKAVNLVRLGLLKERESGGYYDRFRERLIFPVLDALGRVIGFGGRTLGDDPAKYLNSPESELFDKGRSLYGIHAAKDAIMQQRVAVVVEGYTDCLMAHQYEVKNVVATLGTALTGDHAKALSRYADRIVLVFDSDAAGQKAADRAIEVFFGQRVEVRLVALPDGDDPCDFLVKHGKDAFLELVENATDSLDYKWQGTVERLEAADSVNGRKRAADEFLQFVARGFVEHSIDAITSGFLANHVAELLKVSPGQVHERLRQLQRRVRPGQSSAAAAPVREEVKVAADSEVGAHREIIEVLLNRPELLSAVGDVVSGPGDFKDEIHRAIAERLWQYGQLGGSGMLSEILAGVESVQLCGIMTDMAEAGAARGNFEERLIAAVKNIEHMRREDERQSVRELVSTAGEQYGDDAEAAALMEYQSKWQPDPRRPGARQ